MTHVCLKVMTITQNAQKEVGGHAVANRSLVKPNSNLIYSDGLVSQITKIVTFISFCSSTKKNRFHCLCPYIYCFCFALGVGELFTMILTTCDVKKL